MLNPHTQGSDKYQGACYSMLSSVQMVFGLQIIGYYDDLEVVKLLHVVQTVPWLLLL